MWRPNYEFTAALYAFGEQVPLTTRKACTGQVSALADSRAFHGPVAQRAVYLRCARMQDAEPVFVQVKSLLQQALGRPVALEEATSMTIADIKALEGDSTAEEDDGEGAQANSEAPRKALPGKKAAPILTPALRLPPPPPPTTTTTIVTLTAMRQRITPVLLCLVILYPCVHSYALLPRELSLQRGRY